jgi:DNA-binding LytR/AlgR family response regulator
LFLDINLPDLNGIELLKSLKNPPKVIFTTAYSEFALEGFELQITDFLLKPYSFDRFVKAIQKVLQEIETEKNSRNGRRPRNPTSWSSKPTERFTGFHSKRCSFYKLTGIT